MDIVSYSEEAIQNIFSGLKSTIETLENGANYVQS